MNTTDEARSIAQQKKKKNLISESLSCQTTDGYATHITIKGLIKIIVQHQ